jgi:RHS repeat-associated protein
VALDNTSARYVEGNLVERAGLTKFVNPNRYKLTTRAGYEYFLDQSFGIEKVIDPNGHTLTYSREGIVHSSGASIRFNRDVNGRIESITDPKDNVLEYRYNAQDNLTAAQDVLGNSSTYTYNAQHGLVEMFDPLGNKLIKNIYDEDGRLIAQEDNAGNRTDFNHDIAGRQSIVTNRLGHKNFFYYDDKGNVTSTVDALGGTSHFTFDANDNQLSKTDALGRKTSATYNAKNDQLTQTDALGNTVSFTYNDKGQELTITDESGDIFTNRYDSIGNLLSITDPQTNVVSNTLNAKGLPKSTTDALQNKTSYTYNDKGHKLTEKNALGHITTYTYDDNGNRLSESVSRTLTGGVNAGTLVVDTTTYVYDKRNRLISTTNALGQTNTVEFDLIGNQTAMVDNVGISVGNSAENRTEQTYDVYGRLTQTRYADGTTTSKTYDKESNVLSETNRLNNTTWFEYDKLNRVIKTTLADNSVTHTEYDAVGQVIAEIDSNNNKTTYAYDLAGRRIKSTDALNNIHHFTYDIDGNLKTETDALNHTTTYVYDNLDRKIQTVMHNSSVIKTGFDALSRRTSSTDQADITTHYGYDALGRLTTVTDVQGNVTRYTYDEVGNKLTQTDAENRITKWSYDALGRVLTRTLPLGQVETFTYDDSGNMDTKTDFNGELTTFEYDVNNRVTRISYAKDSSTERFTYDATGNRLTATTSQGTWVYTYDVMNRLDSETKPSGDKLTYGYDANGNKTQLTVTYANGDVRIENSTYDALNRLSTVTDSEANKTTYTYDAVGNRETVTHSNANITHYVYDELNRLTQLQDKHADGTIFQQFDYGLDVTGRRTQLTELRGRESTYGFDNLYRLKTEDITDAINGNYNARYSFDKVGNRTQSIINGVTTAFTYDDNDRLTQTGGETYTYDDNGSTLTKAIDSDVTTYTYNAKNKLSTASILANGVTKDSTYAYNVDGIRTQKVETGVTTNFLIDNNQSYAQVIAETDGSDVVIASYTFGADLIAMMKSGKLSNYQYDGLGSTRSLTDSSGEISDTYVYDAFGNDLGKTGETKNDYLYTGEQFDAGLDNYYLRARYYDQGNGRFSQQDTWMGNNSDPITLNKYVYGNADPVRYTDPTGNFGDFSFGGLSQSLNIRMTLASITAVNTGIFLSRASVGLLAGGVVSHTRIDEDAEIVRILSLASSIKLLDLIRSKESSRVNHRSKGKNIVYHYTGRAEALSISASGVGYASAPYKGRLGNGVTKPAGFYSTKIAPWDKSYTQKTLSSLFYGGNANKDVSWFVALEGTPCSPIYNTPKECVFYGNGLIKLDVITIGPNLMNPY